MAEFAIQIGDAKYGPICLLVSIPADSPDEARERLRTRLLSTGSQVIISIPGLSDYIALKINPETIDEALIIRHFAEQPADVAQEAFV